MDPILGSNLLAFAIVTLCIMGFASFMAGQALAGTWRAPWQAVPYGFMLGAADRFLTWAVFQGALFAAVPYLVSTAVLMAVCLGAYRLTLARQMVSQYPWVYERSGLFGWREKGG